MPGSEEGSRDFQHHLGLLTVTPLVTLPLLVSYADRNFSRVLMKMILKCTKKSMSERVFYVSQIPLNLTTNYTAFCSEECLGGHTSAIHHLVFIFFS